MKLEEIQSRLEEIQANNATVVAKADAEKRDLTAEESAQLDAGFAEFDRLTREAEQRKRVGEQAALLRQGRGRQTEPDALPEPEPAQLANRPQPRGGAPKVPATVNPIDRGRWGWHSLGDFALAVKHASHPGGGPIDPRLEQYLAAPTVYGSEGVGADGGFAVPPEFRTAIVQKIMGEDQLLSRTDQYESGSNTLVIPIDETTPWQTTGGIQAYWTGEAAQKTQSKPALESLTVRLDKLTCLVPVTDELQEDAPALDAYLRRKAPDKINFKINLALLQGTGVGQPQGILTSPALVSVAKETGQATNTVYYKNIVNMWSRLYAPSRANAVWLINQDVEPQLWTMAFDPAAATPVPVYLPPGGVSQSPFGLLMGRPVVPSQACNTLGSQGDILLVDLTQYLTARRTGGGAIRTDISIHLWFDFDITAYRFVIRLGGQPWFTTPITPRAGSNTLSPFVTLDQRP